MELHTQESEVKTVLEGRSVIMELHGLGTGVAAPPTPVFVALFAGGLPDARGAVATGLCVAPPAIHVKGPKFVGDGVAWSAIKSGEIRVSAHAL
jgi:hypothetical protein